MKVGLLIYLGDPSATLADKVRRAARAHRRKFGVAPDTCFVHPSEFTTHGPGTVVAAQMLVGNVEVGPLSSVLPHHLWIGCEEKQEEK